MTRASKPPYGSACLVAEENRDPSTPRHESDNLPFPMPPAHPREPLALSDMLAGARAVVGSLNAQSPVVEAHNTERDVPRVAVA